MRKGTTRTGTTRSGGAGMGRGLGRGQARTSRSRSDETRQDERLGGGVDGPRRNRDGQRSARPSTSGFRGNREDRPTGGFRGNREDRPTGGFRGNREDRPTGGNRPTRSREKSREVSPRDARGAQQDSGTSPNLIMGRHPVLEALKAGRPINKILVSQASEGGSLIEIMGKAKAAGVVVQTVPKTVLTSVAGNAHQGIVAYVSPHAYAELDEVLARETGQPPLVVLLDEVSDPHNLGAILRTSEATGVQGVVIPKRRTVPLTETVAKASAGAIEYVPVARVTNLVQAMVQLKEAGYWIVGTDVEGASEYTAVDYKGPVAIVIGAEGSGLSRLVKEHCDFLVRLPMLGKLQSLNASVAAGVILYEVVRQRL